MISPGSWAVTSRISEPARALLSADAVRTSADAAFARTQHGGEPDWRLDLAKLDACADYVAAIIRARYPTLDVPFHARWRHFVFGGCDLWAEAARDWPDADTRARAEFDLAIISVLLDAGAGAAWRFHDDATGLTAARSEGLALASLRFFERGGFSAQPRDPLRVDAARLQRLDVAGLSGAFQVSAQNNLLGLEARAGLMKRLGARVAARPDLFALADAPRPGGLYDVLKARAAGGALPAPLILEGLLDAFGPIWENRLVLDGVALGDCWTIDGLGYTPLHKLSQWLAYSLIEPLERAGLRVSAIDGLTGLAEYRNGGLFVDMGVLVPRDDVALTRSHDVSSRFVVAWRSLTVALLDRIAPLVRARLGVSAEQFPLARVLEGGTWAAGRAIAREKRADGGPPFTILSDGTVF